MHGVGEGNRPTTYPQKWIDTVSQLDQVAFELREHLKHYRFRRLDLVGIVNPICSCQEKYHTEFTVSKLENERALRSLRDDQSEAL